MPSPDRTAAARPRPEHDLGEADRRTLLEVAHASIDHGLENGVPLPVDPARLSPALGRRGASFVTLQRGGQLRGCTGMIEPVRPLAADVAANAFAAAFLDPRFPPLHPAERDDLDLHVSVLSPLEPVAFESLAELLGALEPAVDGLVIEQDGRRATFLPQVWEQLPDPRAFLAALLRKAGLALHEVDPRRMEAWRYTVDEIA